MISTNSFHEIKSKSDFEDACHNLLFHHYKLNQTYRSYCDLINRPPFSISSINEIPFLPISFFKKHQVKIFNSKPKIIFRSSGTTSCNRSQHFLENEKTYEKSFFECFKLFYGDIRKYNILALLPGYYERNDSSLIYMVKELIKKSKSSKSGFYLNNFDELKKNLLELDYKKEKTILIGVSFALLDFIEKNKLNLTHTTIIETGGMKGKRKEITREELHNFLCEGFGVSLIQSEYGMTEILSQAYSKGNGLFECPPWMKILVRQIEDPLSISKITDTGALNIIDLANFGSCPFIASDDVGKIHSSGKFEVLGRIDNSEIRGCNTIYF